MAFKINMSRSTARRFIKVADSSELNSPSMANLGTSILYEIATLLRKKEKEHLTSSGEKKTPDEMTQRELQDLKQLKQRDEQNAQLQSQVEQAQRSESIARKKLEDEQNREPEVVEKYTEPEDYQSIKNMNEHLESEREYYKNWQMTLEMKLKI